MHNRLLYNGAGGTVHERQRSKFNDLSLTKVVCTTWETPWRHFKHWRTGNELHFITTSCYVLRHSAEVKEVLIFIWGGAFSVLNNFGYGSPIFMVPKRNERGKLKSLSVFQILYISTTFSDISKISRGRPIGTVSTTSIYSLMSGVTPRVRR